ncbi:MULTISPECIES: hypothetical protein [Acidiphilium]|uniref:Uncharacterized protein n=1 Tax=Acidiphilium rubrum TaxID=526 RepID=A0A8G2CJ89_ACIRU|nr:MULTISPECIES: hypothetical protein [Acidiphilium]SIQ46826.1 hypothetical protein SAMN05421828_10537 [Acidiphilium rubrum]
MKRTPETDLLDPLDQLHADAENPLIAPSRRVAARVALRELREADTEADRRALMATITRTLRAG